MKHPDRSQLRAICRTINLLLWILLILPFVTLLWLLRLQKPRGRLAYVFFMGSLRFMGMRLTRIGKPSKLRPLMVVANHSSYLDIFVIGSQLPISFTPKRELRSWPIVGWLCVLADSVFVERRPSHMEEARAEMAKRIDAGRVLCLFPEGTTSNGKQLKPFKSGFFSLAEDHHLPVQPASIAYTHIGSEPITDATRELVAWIGEATFFMHFWRLLAMPGVKGTLRWHAPLNLADFADRKALTKAAETIVTAGVMADLPITSEPVMTSS